MRDSVTSRTAVYGPVRTMVWQGSVGDRRPYADLTAPRLLMAYRLLILSEWSASIG